MRKAEAIVHRPIGYCVVEFGFKRCRRSGLRVVDVVPKYGRMVARDELIVLCVPIFFVGSALWLGCPKGRAGCNRTGNEGPVKAAGVIKSHLQTLLPNCGRQLPDDIATGILARRRQGGIGACALPKSEALVMFRRQDNVFGAGVLKDFRSRSRIPLLAMTVKAVGKAVVVVVCAKVFMVIFLRGGASDAHSVLVALA